MSVEMQKIPGVLRFERRSWTVAAVEEKRRRSFMVRRRLNVGGQEM